MVQRGLLPDFSAAALAEAQALSEHPPDGGPAIRDLTDLLWMSVDNESSRDLDQLSVAVPLNGHRTRVMVAVADVDALGREAKVDAVVSATRRLVTFTRALHFSVGTALHFSRGKHRELLNLDIQPL